MSSVRWVVKKSDDGVASAPKTPDKQQSPEKASDSALQPTVKALFDMADGSTPSGVDEQRQGYGQDDSPSYAGHYGGNGSSSGGKDWKQRKFQDTGKSAYGERTNWKASGWQEDQWSWNDYIIVKECHVNVELSYQDLSDADLENLFEHLDQFMHHTVERTHGEYVVNVDLSGNALITDNGITHHLAPFLQTWPICHRLKLFKTSIGDRALKSLSSWVAGGYVHELHLSDLGCRVTSDCIQHILKDITKKKNYPYLSSSGANCPLWLRLEHNGIPNVDELVNKGKQQGMSLSIIDKSDLARIRPGSNTTKRGAKEIPAVNLVLFRVQELRVNRKNGMKEAADSESSSTPTALPPLPFPPPPPPPEPKPCEANGAESPSAAPPPPPQSKTVEAKGVESPSTTEQVDDNSKLDRATGDDFELGSNVKGVDGGSSVSKSDDVSETGQSANTEIIDSKIEAGAEQAKGNCDDMDRIELGHDSIKSTEAKVAEKPRTGILRVLQRKQPTANGGDARLGSTDGSSACPDIIKHDVETKIVDQNTIASNTAEDNVPESANAKLDVVEGDFSKDDGGRSEHVIDVVSTEPNSTEVVDARADELKSADTYLSGNNADSASTSKGKDSSTPLGNDQDDDTKDTEGVASKMAGGEAIATRIEDSETDDGNTKIGEAKGVEARDDTVDDVADTKCVIGKTDGAHLGSGNATCDSIANVGSSLVQAGDEHTHHYKESSTDFNEENKHAKVGQALLKLRVSLHFVQERSVYDRWEHHMRLSADPENEANRILMMMMRLHGQEYLLPTKEPSLEVVTCSVGDTSSEKTLAAHVEANRSRGTQEILVGARGAGDDISSGQILERLAMSRRVVTDVRGKGGPSAAQGAWPTQEDAVMAPEQHVLESEALADSAGERLVPPSSETQGAGRSSGEVVLPRLSVPSGGENGLGAGSSSAEPEPRKKKGKNKISSDSLWAPTSARLTETVSSSDQYQ